MKTSSPRHTLLLLAVCAGAVVAVCAVFGILLPRVTTIRPAFAPTPAPMPPILLTTGALYAPTDHKRLMKIGTALQNKQPIKDADLKWAIDLLQRGSVTDSSYTHTAFVIRTLSQLTNHPSLTPAQSHTLAQTVLSYTDDPPLKEREPVETETGPLQSPAVSVQLTALTVLGSLDDDAARTKLNKLAKTSATLSVRQSAGGLIARQAGKTKIPLH